MTEIVFDTSPAAVGIPGLEATHRWDGGILLNDVGLVSTGGGGGPPPFGGPGGGPPVPAFPRYKLHRIGGLHARPEFEDNHDAAVGRIGELPRLSFKRGKVLTYEGTVQARDLRTLRAGVGQLLAAFAPDDERQMIVELRPEYEAILAAEGGSYVGGYQYQARCIDFACDEDFSGSARTRSLTGGYELPFAISLRMSDPRFYDLTEKVSRVYATAVGDTVVNNGGNAPTDPIVNFWGPFSGGGAFVNSTVNASLNIARAALFTGSFFAVNFANRQVIDAAGGDLRRWLDLANSSWWDAGVSGLAPGDNLLRWIFVASADPTYTFAEVHYHDAYWG